MKIASRPTTIARTPRPSANAARMIAMPRIWPAASGFRPIAWAERPPMRPTPIPGPMTPRAASPAPKYSMSCVPPLSRAGGPVISGTWVMGCVGSVGWLERRRVGFVQSLERLFGDVALLVFVTLDRERNEDERQDAEDQRLDCVEHDLQPEQADRNERDGQRGD